MGDAASPPLAPLTLCVSTVNGDVLLPQREVPGCIIVAELKRLLWWQLPEEVRYGEQNYRLLRGGEELSDAELVAAGRGGSEQLTCVFYDELPLSEHMHCTQPATSCSESSERTTSERRWLTVERLKAETKMLCPFRDSAEDSEGEVVVEATGRDLAVVLWKSHEELMKDLPPRHRGHLLRYMEAAESVEYVESASRSKTRTAEGKQVESISRLTANVGDCRLVAGFHQTSSFRRLQPYIYDG
eukprot:TRINITY_DN90322_c0_g1_i1.p1 TRINITY_DN90322_c0_g1~~TRINITY_DN90322_c0_g1_i1.p1  ORF type:complete len:243 (-),score=44.79 TRINITY_DN90322_c0_g1_i1:823-1551(-)